MILYFVVVRLEHKQDNKGVKIMFDVYFFLPSRSVMPEKTSSGVRLFISARGVWFHHCTQWFIANVNNSFLSVLANGLMHTGAKFWLFPQLFLCHVRPHRFASKHRRHKTKRVGCCLFILHEFGASKGTARWFLILTWYISAFCSNSAFPFKVFFSIRYCVEMYWHFLWNAVDEKRKNRNFVIVILARKRHETA